MTYDQIVTRLYEIEEDLQARQEPYEAAADKKHRLVRDYELRLAQAYMAAQGDTATERKHVALVTVAAAEDGPYGKLLEAEAEYEGLRAAVKVLDQRAMIGMALLKAVTREAGPQPAWSR